MSSFTGRWLVPLRARAQRLCSSVRGNFSSSCRPQNSVPILNWWCLNWWCNQQSCILWLYPHHMHRSIDRVLLQHALVWLDWWAIMATRAFGRKPTWTFLFHKKWDYKIRYLPCPQLWRKVIRNTISHELKDTVMRPFYRFGTTTMKVKPYIKRTSTGRMKHYLWLALIT